MLPSRRPPTHPGEMLLKEFLEPLGVSQVEAAERMHVPFQRLNGIVKGRRAVSADTALLLEALIQCGNHLLQTDDDSRVLRRVKPAHVGAHGDQCGQMLHPLFLCHALADGAHMGVA